MKRESRGSRSPEPTEAELSTLEASLAAWLRSDCPSPQTLGEYQLELLTEPEQARLARHLSACPHCRGELELLQRFLDRSDETPGTSATDLTGTQDPGASGFIRERSFLWADAVASLLGHRTADRLVTPGFAPSLPEGVRGAPSLGALSASPPHQTRAALGLTFTSDEATVAIEARPAAQGRFDLLVLVAPTEGSPGDLPVWLRQETTVVASDRTDAAGNAVFAGLPPGAYDLAVQHASTRIWVNGIRLGIGTDPSRGDSDAPTA